MACKTTDVVAYYNLTAKPKKNPKQNKKTKTKQKTKPTTLIRHTSTSARLNKNMSNRNIRLQNIQTESLLLKHNTQPIHVYISQSEHKYVNYLYSTLIYTNKTNLITHNLQLRVVLFFIKANNLINVFTTIKRHAFYKMAFFIDISNQREEVDKKGGLISPYLFFFLCAGILGILIEIM